jgi:hypothetical protein
MHGSPVGIRTERPWIRYFGNGSEHSQAIEFPEYAGEQPRRRVVDSLPLRSEMQTRGRPTAAASGNSSSGPLSTGCPVTSIEPVHVAAYVEQDDCAPATGKQPLFAIRRLFDWLVTGHIVEANSAVPLPPPEVVADEGRTPVLTAEETRELFDRIVAEANDVPPLRDRALIDVMTYTL